MSSREMKRRGSTVTIEATITDESGNPLTPDSQLVEIYDPDGNLKASSTTPTLVSTGVYRFSYTLPSDAELGEWLVKWKVEKGAYVEIEPLRFEVTEY